MKYRLEQVTPEQIQQALNEVQPTDRLWHERSVEIREKTDELNWYISKCEHERLQKEGRERADRFFATLYGVHAEAPSPPPPPSMFRRWLDHILK